MYKDSTAARHLLVFVMASFSLTGCWTSNRDLTVLDRAPTSKVNVNDRSVIERLVARVRDCYIPVAASSSVAQGNSTKAVEISSTPPEPPKKTTPPDTNGKAMAPPGCAAQYSFLATNGQNVDAKQLRNAVVNDLLIVSDDNEKKWRSQVKDAINTREIALDIGALLFSTAGSVVPHASLAKIFSGTSTGVQGANTAWDKRYIGEQTIDLVINSVASARLTKKADILNSLQKQAVEDYGISDGIRDAVEYDSLLTLQVGVSTLQQNTAQKSNDATQKIQGLAATSASK